MMAIAKGIETRWQLTVCGKTCLIHVRLLVLLRKFETGRELPERSFVVAVQRQISTASHRPSLTQYVLW